MKLLQTLANGITVGEVAGIISGATTIIAQTLPLLVTFILVWSITNQHLNASTWSTAARTLQGTLWPTILRSDSSRGTFVARPVYVASATLTSVILLLFITHILTPLPLTAEIHLEGKLSLVSFIYAPDSTFFGQGTASRPAQPLKRMCGTQVFTDCTPPADLFDKLSSGTIGTTIAGPRDIQFRNFFYYYPQGSKDNLVPVGLTRPMQYLLLDASFAIVEGVIVDPYNGGVGFRNHTVPVGVDLGATWQEDLLWIQPETVCSANNFSMHFPFEDRETPNRYLQDDGAFASRNWSIPEPRWDIYGPDSLFNVTGPIPDLTQRAFLAAWWDNYYSAHALNISGNSTLSKGDKYQEDVTNYTSFISPFAITISDMDGGIFDQAWPFNVWKFTSANLDRFIKLSNLISGVPASYQFSDNFLAYGRRCSGFNDSDPPKPLKPYIRCGNLYGVAIPEETSMVQFQIGSMVQQPVYTCASSVKATIKTVEFTFNGTSTLSNLIVLGVVDKNYSSPDKEPLWGVENVDPSRNWNISDISLLWGIVNDTYANDNAIATIQGQSLYLPVAYFNLSMDSFQDSLAAVSVFTAAWNDVYQSAAYIAGASVADLPSYSGDTQYSLFLKWRDLSSTANGAANILNLIWTDIVASAVVGTKTGFENEAAIQPAGDLGQRAVQRHHSVVVYGNLLFAIPALLALGLWTVLLIWAMLLLLLRRATCNMLLHYMNQTSLGRAVYDTEHPNREIATSSSTVWAKEVGNEPLGIRAYSERASENFKTTSSKNSPSSPIKASLTGSLRRSSQKEDRKEVDTSERN